MTDILGARQLWKEKVALFFVGLKLLVKAAKRIITECSDIKAIYHNTDEKWSY